MLYSVEMLLVVVFITGNLAIVGGVLPANSWPGLVNLAGVVGPQVSAHVVDIEVPIAILNVDFCVFVERVPSYAVKIAGLFWRLYRQAEVTTTHRGDHQRGKGV